MRALRRVRGRWRPRQGREGSTRARGDFVGRAGGTERDLHGHAVPRSRAPPVGSGGAGPSWPHGSCVSATGPPAPWGIRWPYGGASRPPPGARRGRRWTSRGRVHPWRVGDRQERTDSAVLRRRDGDKQRARARRPLLRARVGPLQGARHRHRQPQSISRVAAHCGRRSASATGRAVALAAVSGDVARGRGGQRVRGRRVRVE